MAQIISFVEIRYYRIEWNPQNVFPSSIFRNIVCNTALCMEELSDSEDDEFIT